MKPTLADYLVSERVDIFKQQETIEKLSSLFVELKGLYEKIDMEKQNDPPAASKSQQGRQNSVSVSQSQSGLSDSRSRRPSESPSASTADALPPHSALTISSRLKLASTDKVNDMCNLLQSNQGGINAEEETTGLGFSWTRAPATISSTGPLRQHKSKTDSYRRELLAQIEEKRRAKQMELDREKAAERELEKKITQQRLAMYLDYLEERQRGDFIVRKKTAEAAELVAGGEGDAATVRFQLPSTSTAPVAGTSQPGALSEPDDQATPVPAGGKGSNILANLSEVRKIIQQDHLEMLQRLLELDIK